MPRKKKMAPQNTDVDAMQVQGVMVVPSANKTTTSPASTSDKGGSTGGGGGGVVLESCQEESVSEGSIDRIPLRQWVMHGGVMFGREFCYAMETALVTPVLLQIGLPEQYYSLTWFLSPILGLIFTPLIGSASDRCTLRWGRRRPFILALCVGVLLGVALFLNGSLIGLAIGDVPNNQPIGIVLTVLGVVVLDFSADATEGPIRAYLLDVADTEEQDMALNIHAFSSGCGGAVGYALGGLDWTHTFLGSVFKSQEQILFFFAAILFTISVALHLFSIEEQRYSPQQDRLDEEADGASTTANKVNGSLGRSQSQNPPSTMLVGDDDIYDPCDRYGFYGNGEEDRRSLRDMDMDFLDVEMARSKSDSVLQMADATLDHLDHDALFLRHIEPSIFADRLSSYHGSPPRRSSSAGSQDLLRTSKKISRLSQFLQEQDRDGEEALLNNQLNEQKTPNGRAHANGLGQGANGHACMGMKNSASTNASMRRRRHIFYRQPSCTFSYYGRVGSHRYRYRRANAALLIKPSRSLNDIYEAQRRQRRKQQNPRARHQSGNTNSSGDTESEEGVETETTVRLLWLSMLKMPPELMRLCACHLLTWFSIIAEAVFYTDFMGQVIYHGDPTAPANSTELQNYNKGVQMGCWGLVIYALTAASCSALLQKYLDNFDLSIKVIYVLGTLGFSIGTAIMAIFPNVYVSMVMISSMGFISMSISYCPYALLGQYHETKEYIHHSPGNSKRGFGIDCAILSCQVYISQILVASALGAAVDATGSVRVIPMVASGGSFLGFLTAWFLVIYPSHSDMDAKGEQRALTAPAAENSVTEKPSLLKLTKKGTATTTCEVECESTL
ncbi:solute carrier family 45 member 4 [Esox lucius]|uniref:Solute carrier family 45 member 4 n=1 Tax=Esox lucius TaxID=8010 RepID=A0A3P9ALL1_ESOLU|nr:solute carrier family 45 member 4 [Esox lucius]XP_010871464.2 solute carrier family 45 member 4 [Esox lucius]XP_010871465.2 solute carrier family 45 member 4 [Esox lucius]XP_010871466.2 solute carrier family 45 member 4 [Esox lucius]XP_010871467.2 solute carrier family 45 member 4 [Esox lucius]XP_034150680.1 solute carrier family 45 member 4 [Esox lucius]